MPHKHHSNKAIEKILLRKNTIPIAGVGFDWDDTIYDSTYFNPGNESIKFAIEEMANQGVKTDFTIHNKKKQEGYFSFLKRIYHDEEIAWRAHRIQLAKYYEICDSQVKAVDGALDTMRFLKAHGIPFFIASNSYCLIAKG
jgi:FMN phosphatase YigB (HAD superfamily)